MKTRLISLVSKPVNESKVNFIGVKTQKLRHIQGAVFFALRYFFFEFPKLKRNMSVVAKGCFVSVMAFKIITSHFSVADLASYLFVSAHCSVDALVFETRLNLCRLHRLL